jgi:hypothetical protein
MKSYVPSRLRRSFAFAGVIALMTAMALSGCGKKEETSGWGPAQGQSQADQTAPVQQQQQAHHDSDSGMGSFLAGAALGAVGGYLGGRAVQPAPQPQVYQQPPVYQAPAQPRAPFWSRFNDKKVASPAAPAAAPGVVKPPVVSTAPKTIPVPAPTMAPKPSYAGPSSYSSAKQSAPTFRYSAPSRPSSPSFSRR